MQQFVPSALKDLRQVPVLTSDLSFVDIAQTGDGNKTVIEDVGIQVAVLVVIQEAGMGGEAILVQVVFCGCLGKAEVSIIDEELIGTVVALYMSGVADIDI